MGKKLLIVESPKKARTIQKFLKGDWIVRASLGHIRKLAQDGEDKLGFDLVGEQVKCRYVPINSQARKTIGELKKLAREASVVFLATDQDREGEGISFHLAEALGLRRYQRITYNEVTEKALREAIAHPRQLDHNLVGASRARSCLDKLVGYKISPILWSLNIGAKSTGRVQAPTLHIICQRERQIQSFKPEPYWSVWVEYKEGWKAYFQGEESRVAESKERDQELRDDSEATDNQKVETVRVRSEAEAQRLLAIARSQPHRVVKVESKITAKKPPPPFTTSSLQQAAGARLKFSPEKTMQIAQHLFEAGLVTYHRTDSTNLSESFVTEARKYLQEKDPGNLPPTAPQYRKKKKNAQEAHEAIRPSDLTKPSTQLKQELDSDRFALYELIWRRAMASQCQSAKIEKTRITSQSGSVWWLARGQVVKFRGYARYWRDLGKNTELPPVKEGDNLHLKQADAERKMTQPPPYYSEAKLVQVMERLGIGRPSTYSSTVRTLKERDYVKLAKGKLNATELGLEVDRFQGNAFPQLIESQFTAEMENRLDAIAQGELDWQRYLTGWNRNYFAAALLKAKAQAGVEAKEGGNFSQSKREKSRIKCPKCGELMDKIPSKSKKLSRPYFLKCASCAVVMFYNKQQKTWLEPNAQSAIPTITEYLCPVCSSFLAEREYQKNGQTKKMLVCSTNQGDKKHQDVVFFQSKGKWWSPKFGELQ